MTPKKRPKPGWTGRDPPTPSSAERPWAPPAVQRQRIKAWGRLRTALAQCLGDLGRREYLEIAFDRAAYYVRFSGRSRGGFRVEAASNAYIEPPTALLTESQYAKAFKLGWQPAEDMPTEQRPRSRHGRGPTQFYLDIGPNKDYKPLARLVVRTFREVYRITEPEHLLYDAFTESGASIRYPTLGLARHMKRKRSDR